MNRLALAALALLVSGRVVHAQRDASPQFTCGQDESGVQRSVDATFAGTEAGSVSDVLGTVHGTFVRHGAATPASEAECRRLVAALTSKSRGTLAGTRISFHRVETTGAQPHVFAAFVTPVLSSEPDAVGTGHDLVYVLGADDTLLFYTLAVNPSTP